MRFTTYERIEESPLRVIKKNGERVRFDRERILHGMLRACEKLPVPMADIEEAALRIETRCQGEYDREVQSAVIGTLVMEELANLHQVAYVRFASVYREFKDATQFMSELERMIAERPVAADASDTTGSDTTGSDTTGQGKTTRAKKRKKERPA